MINRWRLAAGHSWAFEKENRWRATLHLESLGGEPAPALRPWAARAGVGSASRPRRPCHAGSLAGGHALGRRSLARSLQRAEARTTPARRWVALPVRPAPDLLRPGRNSGRFRVEGRSALSVRPLRPGPQLLPWGALCPPIPPLNVRLPCIRPLRCSLPQF